MACPPVMPQQSPRFRPYASPNHQVSKGRYITSNDPRGYIPVYEYPLNGQWIMMDIDDGYILWTGIWKALGNSKADIVKMIDSQPDLAPVIRRVRGGYLKIQGTWMPYEVALRLSRRVAWPIREDLVPLFGPTFPSTCLSPDQPGCGQVVSTAFGQRQSRQNNQVVAPAPPVPRDLQTSWAIPTAGPSAHASSSAHYLPSGQSASLPSMMYRDPSSYSHPQPISPPLHISSSASPIRHERSARSRYSPYPALPTRKPSVVTSDSVSLDIPSISLQDMHRDARNGKFPGDQIVLPPIQPFTPPRHINTTSYALPPIFTFENLSTQYSSHPAPRTHKLSAPHISSFASPITHERSVLLRSQTVQQPNHEFLTFKLDSSQDLTKELQKISQYPVAFGGFGDIWKCDLVKPGGNVQVAVKTIRALQSDDRAQVQKNSKRVRRELKVWGRLKHHSILPLWGVANDFGPYPAMICPWADNGTLTNFLEHQQDMLSSQDKFSLLNDVALGLQYLHSKSIVHGDLTGSNVLIYGNGQACLADFGLSTMIVEFVGTSYLTSSIKGNIRWAAAELFEVPEDDEEDESEASVSLSTECDIYSFGSIFLQILTCKVPYYNVKKDNVVLGQVIRGKKPEPPKESQIMPVHWDFIQQCWLPRASRPSAEEVVAFIAAEKGDSG